MTTVSCHTVHVIRVVKQNKYMLNLDFNTCLLAGRLCIAGIGRADR